MRAWPAKAPSQARASYCSNVKASVLVGGQNEPSSCSSSTKFPHRSILTDGLRLKGAVRFAALSPASEATTADPWTRHACGHRQRCPHEPGRTSHRGTVPCISGCGVASGYAACQSAHSAAGGGAQLRARVLGSVNALTLLARVSSPPHRCSIARAAPAAARLCPHAPAGHAPPCHRRRVRHYGCQAAGAGAPPRRSPPKSPTALLGACVLVRRCHTAPKRQAPWYVVHTPASARTQASRASVATCTAALVARRCRRGDEGIAALACHLHPMRQCSASRAGSRPPAPPPAHTHTYVAR